MEYFIRFKLLDGGYSKEEIILAASREEAVEKGRKLNLTKKERLGFGIFRLVYEEVYQEGGDDVDAQELGESDPRSAP